jgi:hypothetical protein
MKSQPVKNLPASVHQRLLNKAKDAGRTFNEMLQYYAMERFIYRLSKTPGGGKFVLKGALMFMVWRQPGLRPTMDIDLLGRLKNDIDAVCNIMRNACELEVEPDGLAFDAGTVVGARIAEDAEYEGVRVSFNGRLDNARVFLQIDIGFGDAVSPSAEMVNYPVILEFPAPRMRGYSRESVLAEKFHAMVKHGILNTRMKDFYDVRILSKEFDFKGKPLADAVKKTFAARDTAIPLHPMVFSDAFRQDRSKATLWNAFLKKSHLSDAPQSFEMVIADIELFLVPVIATIGDEGLFEKQWRAGGPWIE